MKDANSIMFNVSIDRERVRARERPVYRRGFSCVGDCVCLCDRHGNDKGGWEHGGTD